MTNLNVNPEYPVCRVLLAEGNQVVRTADYIGSFLVAGKGHHDRAEVVRQKLEAARSYTHSKPILLLISLNGIKVCRENNEHVYMAHALRRVSYATCDPDSLQFAFLAREPKAQSNVQYCHAFVTATAAQAEELNNIIGEAFRLAYTRQQQLQQQLIPVCSPSEADFSRHHLQNGDAITTSSKLHLQNTASSAHQTRLSQMICQPTAELPPDRVIHKPLPPLPDDELERETLSRQSDTKAVFGDKDSSPPPPPPPSSPVVIDTTMAIAQPDEQRDQHRLHKVHKHHKHRHKARPRAALAQSGFNPSEGARLECTSHLPINCNGNFLVNRGEFVADEGTQILLRTHPSPSHGAVIPGANHIPLPVPPPRGPSQHRHPNDQTTGAVDGNEMSSSPVLSTTHINGGPECSRELMLISTGIHHNCRLNSGGETAKPLLSADISKLRPQSEVFTTRYSLHLYDMADHQSCGVVAAQPAAPTAHQRRLSQPALSVVTTSLVSPRSTPVTATGIGAATRAASSLSSGSSGISLLHTVTTQVGQIHKASEAGPQPAVSAVSSTQVVTQLSCSSPLPSHDAMELANAVWYQPSIPRETVLEMLLQQPSGSFVIRDSASHNNCYALSVRFGNEATRLPLSCHRASSAASTGLSNPQNLSTTSNNSVYPQVSGINHFLIEKTAGGGVRLMGLDKEWPSLSCLVLHLTVMPEMLPCPLRLPKPPGCGAATAIAVNPAFRPDDDPSGVHFRPINVTDLSCMPGARTNKALDIGEDYQRLSDFSSIMADLKPRSRLRHK